MSGSQRLLDLTAGKVSLCGLFRFGLLAIDKHDRDLIARAMGLSCRFRKDPLASTP